MAKTVILHLTGEDPLLAEIDQEPQPGDAFLRVTNMRKRDGKPVPYLASGVQAVIYPGIASPSSRLCPARRSAARWWTSSDCELP